MKTDAKVVILFVSHNSLIENFYILTFEFGRNVKFERFFYKLFLCVFNVVPSQPKSIINNCNMHFENFTERDIPYETLANYGLTHEMIDDLPESVMTKFLHGCYTPILPLRIKTEAEDIEFLSRIALFTGVNGEVKVMLKPKIETSSLGLYSAEQQEELRNGKTIIANSPSDIKNGDFGVKCFVQYDEDTNQVLSVPTHAIGENIRVLTDILGLDYETVRAMQQGEPQSVEWQNSENGIEQITFGIDLREEYGIRMANGGLQEWVDQSKDFKERYNFGLYGVWKASEDGKSGVYIPEEEYTDEIREEMQRAGNRNRATVRMSSLKI